MANLEHVKIVRAGSAAINDWHTQHPDDSLDLQEATFHRQDFVNVNFSRCNLRNADLSTCNITGAVFSLADMRGAKLPENYEGFTTRLSQIEAASLNARRLAFVIAGLVGYVVLTFMSMNDAVLLTDSPTINLPIVNVSLNGTAFSIAAPTLLGIMLLYFQAYLHWIHSIIVELPSDFPDGGTLSQRLYPWLWNAMAAERFNRQLTSYSISLQIMRFAVMAAVPAAICIGIYKVSPSGNKTIGWSLCIVLVLVLITTIAYELQSFKLLLSGSDASNSRKSARLLVLWIAVAALIGGGAAHRVYLGITHQLPSLILSSANLSNSELSNIILPHSNFSRANLAGTQITNATLTDSHFSGAQLDGAIIGDEVNCFSSVFVGASFEGARIGPAQLSLCDFTDANWRGARLSKCRLKEARLVDVNAAGASLRSCNLEEVEMANAICDGAKLSNVNLHKGRLVGSSFVGAFIDGTYFTNTDLTGADLSNATLRKCSMVNARLIQANLVGTELSRCDLRGAKLHGAIVGSSNWLQVINQPANKPIGLSATKWRVVKHVGQDGGTEWRICERGVDYCPYGQTSSQQSLGVEDTPRTIFEGTSGLK